MLQNDAMSADKSLSFRDVLPWMLGFLALTNLPYLAAWLLPPPGKQFVGAFVNPDDLSTYLAAIRQGAAGRWLFHNPFSPEPWQPKLMLLPYLLVGKLAGLIGGGPLLWFHLFRVTAVILTLTIILLWIQTIFPQRQRWQTTGWLVVVFGSGLGWLVAILRLTPGLPPDLAMPEWSVLMALFHTPHFALGLGLELLLFITVHQMITADKGLAWAGWAAVCGVALAVTYVYLIPVVGLVIGLVLLAEAVRQRRIPWRVWRYGVVVLLPLTLLLLYYAVIANRDPYFANYARYDHIVRPPSFLLALIGVGMLGILALVGSRRWLRQQRPFLLPIWIVTNGLLMYLPIVQYSGRFALGLMIPVATMAAFSLEDLVLPWLATRPFYRVFSRLTPTPAATLRRAFLLLLVPSTLITPLLLVKTAVTTTDFPTYLADGEAAAANWLAANSTAGDLTLSYYPMGNYLPRAIPGKVFLGQLFLTTNKDEKLALTEQFWRAETSSAWRAAFLDEWGIDFVYVGQYEKALAGADIVVPGTAVYDQSGVTIYRVGRP